MTPPPQTVDVHHHFATPAFIALMREQGSVSLRGLDAYTPERSLEEMAAGGVASAMLSVTTPGIWFGDLAQTRRLARELNDFGAAMVAEHPGRFGLFAVLSLPDVAAALEDISYAFDVLHADGVGLLTSYDDRYLGDPAFAEVFRELNRRRAVVFVHASVASCCRDLVAGVPEFMVEYPTDTTRTIASLLLSGRAAECPDIRFIFTHGGGTLTALPSRLLGEQASAAALAAPADPNSRLGLLRRFYYDVASSANPIQLQALKQLVSCSQVLFGSDFPFWPSEGVAAALRTCGLSADDARAVDHENAWRILPRFSPSRSDRSPEPASKSSRTASRD